MPEAWDYMEGDCQGSFRTYKSVLCNGYRVAKLVFNLPKTTIKMNT